MFRLLSSYLSWVDSEYSTGMGFLGRGPVLIRLILLKLTDIRFILQIEDDGGTNDEDLNTKI